MKILIPSDDVQNAYVPSLVKAYQSRGCEVITGPANFFQSNYRPEILHLQWPESLYRFGKFSVFGNPLKVIPDRIEHFRRQGSVIVWTVHNIRPHDTSSGEIYRSLYNAVINFSDVIVHHGQASVDIMEAEYHQIKTKSNIICPHGDYLIQYKNIDENIAREELNIPQDRTVMLSFGNIRSYKGFDLVPKIFSRWEAKKKYLMIAGRFNLNSGSFFDRLFRLWHGQIRSRTRCYGYDLVFIPNERVPLYFSAADIVLISHSRGLTSGVLAMAATFSKPVVYPRLGNFVEQMDGWIAESFEVGNIDSAVDATNRLTKRIICSEQTNNSVWLQKNSWAYHVDTILKALKFDKG